VQLRFELHSSFGHVVQKIELQALLVMTQAPITFRLAVPRDVPQLVSLHFAVFDQSTHLATMLGRGFIRRCYEWYVGSWEGFVVVAEDSTGIVGLCAFNEGTYYRVFKANVVSAIWVLALRPLTLVRAQVRRRIGALLQRVIAPQPRMQQRSSDRHGCLALLAVHPSVRGRRVAQGVVREGIARCAAKSWRAIDTAVHVGNPAIAVYERFGFVRNSTRDTDGLIALQLGLSPRQGSTERSGAGIGRPSGERLMKVIHLAPRYAPAWKYGGTVRAVTMLAEATASLGHEVVVVASAEGTQYERSASIVSEEVNGVRVHYCPSRSTFAGTVSPLMSEALAMEIPGASIAHFTSTWIPTAPRLAAQCRRAGVPYLSSPSGCLCPFSMRKGWWKKWPYFLAFEGPLHRLAAAIHATSPLEGEELAAMFPSVRVEAIPNICEDWRWYPDADAGAEFRSSIQVSPDDVVLLSVGRIDPIKNLAFLASLPKQIDGRAVHVAIVGPHHPRESKRIQDAFARSSAPRLVMTGGFGEDRLLRGAYSGADVFVMPSHHESFGCVITESLLCGTPVVASTTVGGALMLEGIVAMRVVPFDVRAWDAAVRELLGQRVSATERGQVKDLASRETIARRMADLYVLAMRS